MAAIARTALLAVTLACIQLAHSADSLEWSVPDPVRPAIQSRSFKAAFDIGGWINPFYLRGDFDGDGVADYAVLVVSRSGRKKGIAIWLSGKAGSGPIVVGAGTRSRAGAGESDDWDFFDAWQVYGKHGVGQGAGGGRPPTLKGEAILIEKSESASGILYWDGKQFRWYQQGD